jgi:2-polyprenyl-6-methoxyphenol hydroxylase-like FAD-dependent oxidoreductase
VRVLIIGGGIGGLCLAQGLSGAGIDVEVYDRTPANTATLRGYGIHLNRHGCQALRECLPQQNWERFDATAGYAGDLTRFYDEHLRTLAVCENEAIGPRRPVSRTGLHDILRDGLPDGMVHPGKEFTGYESTPDGRLLVRFADGTGAVGDVLIGADGGNSRVRAQYLPDVRRIDLGILNVAGRYSLGGRGAADLPADLIDGAPNSIVPAGSGWMFVSAWRATGEEYVVWAYVAELATYPADVLRRSPSELRDVVLGRIEGWAPELSTLVRDGDTASVTTVPLRSMPTLRRWQPGAVTLLGDAIHNMTPMAGVGANTALRDAGVLRAALVDVTAGRRGLVDAIGGYEAEMRDYANRAVSVSRRNAEHAASDTRLPRLGFRTLLRVAQAVPPVKRALFASS